MSTKNARILGIRLDEKTDERLRRFEAATLIEGVSLARAALIASLDSYEANESLTLPLKIVSSTQHQKSPSQTGADLVKPPAWTPPTSRVHLVASTSRSRASAPAAEIANIVPLPAQHVVSLNESAKPAPIPARDETLGAFPKPSRKPRAKNRDS
jgi:hypothetical protein